jgi:hypothetical protein
VNHSGILVVMFEVIERFPILRRIAAGIAESSGLVQGAKIRHPNFGLVVGVSQGRAFAQAGSSTTEDTEDTEPFVKHVRAKCALGAHFNCRHGTWSRSRGVTICM